jgi:hypothetical protein
MDLAARSAHRSPTPQHPGEAAFKSRLHRARLAVRPAVDDVVGPENDT